jgi:hypothetical protein
MAPSSPAATWLYKALLMPVTLRSMFNFCGAGMVAGLLMGYITMGTLHAVHTEPPVWLMRPVLSPCQQLSMTAPRNSTTAA